MGFIALAAVATIVLFVLLGFKNKVWAFRKRQILCLFGLVFIIGSMMITVPTGHTGILTTFGKVEDNTLEAGLHFKLPYQEVVVMDNRTQKSSLNMNCFSSDIQEVSVTYSINYQIDKKNAQTIYKTIGTNYYEITMVPRIQEAVKSVLSKYTAESLIEKRDLLSKEITEILEKDMASFNIEIVNTALEDLDFSDAFTQAVEDKQVAQQQYLKAQTEQEQKTMEQEATAKRQRITAEAEADVAKIKANAEADVIKIQAEAAEYAGQKDAAINKALADTLTEVLVEYYKIKQWDGKLPEYFVSGSDGGVFPILGSIDTNK